MTVLTAEVLQGLPPGACKLLLALQLEPAASEARQQELTGYKTRWLRKLRGILKSVGLFESQTGSLEGDLVALGLEAKIARQLVETCSTEVIEESIAYVRGRRDIKNPAGYLVKRLQEKAKEKPPEVSKTQTNTHSPPPEVFSPAPLVPLPLLPQEAEFYLLAHVVTAACGYDPALHPDAWPIIQRMYETGYRAEDVGYFLQEYWPTIWPGKTGERPTLKALLEHIGHAKHLLDMNESKTEAEEVMRRTELLRSHLEGREQLESLEDLLPPIEGNPQFSSYAKHPRYKRHIEALIEEDERVRREEREGQIVAAKREQERRQQLLQAIPPRVKDAWRACLGQLQIQLNRATYDTWLRDVQLRGFEGNCLTIEAGGPEKKDWLERHLLWSMTDTFNGMYRGKEKVIIRVVIKSGESAALVTVF